MSNLCVHPGIEDQPHWTQKTDPGLIGRPATRRHPTETSAGHLPPGEWVSARRQIVSRDPWRSSAAWVQISVKESTSPFPDGWELLWGSYSLPSAAVATQPIAQIFKASTKWPPRCSSLPAGLSWILITGNWLCLSHQGYALMSL